MGSQVPSSTHVSNSQHGGKVLTFEPQETIRIRFIIIEVGILIILCKSMNGTCVESGVYSLLLDPILNTSPKPRILKKCCHVSIHVILGTWNLGLGTRVNDAKYDI